MRGVFLSGLPLLIRNRPAARSSSETKQHRILVIADQVERLHGNNEVPSEPKAESLDWVD
jgi:hypothetical protein